MAGPRLRPAMRVTALLGSVLSSLACAPTEPSTSTDAGVEQPLPPPQDPPYLWYAGAGLNAFTALQTEQSGNDGAQYRVTPLGMQNFHDLAFDAQGNLWTVPFSGDQLIRLPAARLPPASSALGPDLIITSAALQSAQNLAFDPDGNLWVVSYDGAGQSIATISRFDDPSGLSGKGALAAAATIVPGPSTDEQQRFKQPSAIAFDGDGNLWLAAAANVLRFDQPQGRTGDVALSPSAVVAGGDAYAGLAFDATGALWITGAGGGYFVERIDHPASLSGTVSPSPGARISLPSQGGVLFAGGMAFDADGALWIAMSNGLLKVRGAVGLTGSVQVTPDVVLGTTAAPDLSSKLVLRGGSSAAPSQ